VFLSEPEFALAVEKERCRSERRELSFCIALFDLESPRSDSSSGSNDQIYSLANSFRQRLRITDEVGSFRDAFAVLLPETIPAQAAMVVNDLESIASDLGLKVSSDIFAYPEVGDNHCPANERGNDGVFSVSRQPGEDRDDTQLVSPSDEATEDLVNSNANTSSVATVQRPAQSSRAGTVDKLHPAGMPVKIQRLKTLIPTPRWKRGLDIAGAGCGLLVLSPVFAITAIVVRLDSRGPAYFKQWREGKDGQLFEIYKFRTMRQGADDEKQLFREESEQDGPAFKIKDDPRLTKVGKYLRKTCIDELPQLLNVLKGEMSLVGPRPLPVDESLNCSHWHRRRLDVLPGMTCIWQVDGGRDIPFDDWMRMDLDYVRQRSIGFDLRLIFKTAMVTLLHRGSV